MKSHWISEANRSGIERKYTNRSGWHRFAKTQANRAVRRGAREDIDNGLAEMDYDPSRNLDAGDVYAHYAGNPILIAAALCYLLDQPSELEHCIGLFTEREMDQDDWGYYEVSQYYLPGDKLFAHDAYGSLTITEDGWHNLHRRMGIMPLTVPPQHGNPEYVVTELGELL